jgi:hypothetical protein
MDLLEFNYIIKDKEKKTQHSISYKSLKDVQKTKWSSIKRLSDLWIALQSIF